MTLPQCGARKVRRIIESRRRKHQSQVIITPRAKEEMKRRLIFRTDGLAALNVIILTDCWQVVHYQRCTVDEVKPHIDRKCSWGWNRLRGVRSKEEKKILGCDLLFVWKPILQSWFSQFNAMVSEWREIYWPRKWRRTQLQCLRASWKKGLVV